MECNNRKIKLRCWAVMLIGVLFSTAAFGQQLSIKELDALQQSAYEKLQAKEYQGALAAFEQCMRAVKGARDVPSRNRYKDCAFKAVLCCEKLELYAQEIALYDEMMHLGGLQPQEQKEIELKYAVCALFYSNELLIGKEKQTSKAYALLDKALVYTKDQEMVRRLLKQQGYAAFFEAGEKLLQQNYSEATVSFEKALQLFRTVETKKDQISVLMQLAGIKKRNGENKEALALYEEVVSLANEANEGMYGVEAMKEQMLLYENMGEFDKSVAASVKMNELLRGIKDPETVITYNHTLADEAYRRWGNLDLAEVLFKKNLEMLSALDDSKKHTWGHLTNLRLSEICYDKGRYEEALRYDEKKMESYLCMFEVDSPQKYLAYHRRAQIFSEMGERDSAFKYMDSVFYSQKMTKLEPVVIAGQYTARGQLFAQFKEYDHAVQDFKYANQLLCETYPQNGSYRLNTVALLGGALYKQGKQQEAKRSYQEYAELCKLQYGSNSIEYANAIYYLANIKALCGEINDGRQDYIHSMSVIRGLLKEQLRYLPANSREAYWNGLSERFYAMAAFALKSGATQNEFTLHSYNALLLSKGLLLHTDRALDEMIKKNGSKEDLALYNKVAQARECVIKLQSNHNASAEELKTASAVWNDLDKQLVQKSSEYASYGALVDWMYQDVRQLLKENDVLMDITDFRSEKGVQQYVAYIIKKGWEFPLLLPLFKQEQMDSLLSLANGHVDELYQLPIAAKVLELVWNKVEKYVPRNGTLYYVPSGFMHRIALESLPVADGELLGSKYNFVRLTSAREVGQSVIGRSPKPQKAVLYGGLQYDMDAHQMLAESKKYELMPLLAKRGGVVKGDSIYRSLKMTDVEVKEIAEILKKQRIDVRSYVKTLGTEESFFALDGKSPQMIHLATHGFYYTPDETKDIAALRGYKDAMSLTGLILSGGNAGWRGIALPHGVMDGILTADDISKLDLTGTDLVVLSACETGRGKVTSEGLYGLQRAFKKAGAQTLVMTLWTVSDQVTKEFMLLFYENLIKKKWDKRKAFEQAKTQIRKKYEEAYYWAGFVMLD